MSRRKKIILVIFIGIIVLRETGVVSLNYYRSTMTSNTSCYGTKNSTTFDSPCSDLTGSEIPIVVEYEGNTFREAPLTSSELLITLSNTNKGLGWIPLYKNIDFSANGSYYGTLILKDKSSGCCKCNNLAGNISITGSIKVTGFCS